MSWTPILQTKKEWKPILSTKKVASPSPKTQGLLVEAQKAQEEAKKANSKMGLLKQTGKEIYNTLTTSEQRFGQSIGDALYAGKASKQLEEEARQKEAQTNVLIAQMKANRAKGKSNATLISSAKNWQPITNLQDITPSVAKTNRQILGEGMGVGLDLATTGVLQKGAKTFGLLSKANQAAKVTTPIGILKNTLKSTGVGAGVGYGYDVSNKLQNDVQGKEVFKPGLGTLIGGGIPLAIGGAQMAQEGRKLYQSMTPTERQAGFAKLIPASEEFKVGDVLDPQGKTNMKGKVTIREVKGNTLKFVDSEGTEFAGMPRSTVRDLVNGGSWKKSTEEIGRSRYKVAATKMREAYGIGDNAKFLEAQKEMTEANKLFRGTDTKQDVIKQALDANEARLKRDGWIKPGVVEGDPAQTLKNVEKRVGVEPVLSKKKQVNRAEYDEGYFKRKPVELPQKLQEKELDLQLRKQYVEESPLNKLSKYESKTDKGRLPEILGTGKSKFSKQGDEIIDEATGYRDTYAKSADSEKVRADYEKFAQDKQALKADELAFKDEVKKYKDSQKVASFRTKAEAQLGRPVPLTSREKALIDGRVAPGEGLLQGNQKIPSSKAQSSNAPLLSGKSEGELRTLEASANQALARASQGGDVGVPSLTKMIERTPTPVNKKVGILDYLRTPDRVLKKIGLGKQADEIRVQYDKYLDELPKNIDKITAWSKRVPQSNERIFKYLDGQAIDLRPEERKVAVEIKAWLEDWADRLKLPKDNRISNYITHIFDDQLIKKEFDEDLAKIIADKVPGSVYDPFLQKRLGAMGYKQDVWKALDAYVKRATRKVHMDSALSNLEEVAGHLEMSQWDYVKKYADRLNLRPTEWDTKFDNSLKQVVGYRFGQRPVANLSRTLRQMTFRGMLGGNISSALRNLSQGVNTYSKLGERHTASGYLRLITRGTKELKEQGILRDNFIQDRTLSSTKKFMEKLDKGLFLFFDAAEKINRGAAYYGAKSKALAQGMDETKAIEFAKKIVRDTQFLYSNVDTPLMMQGDIAKVMMQFMSYPVKQTEFIAEMAKNKEFAGMARYVVGGLAFVYTAGKLMNMEPKELIPWSDYLSGDRKFGAPPSLKFPVEVIKAGLGTEDQYGNERSLKDKAKDIGKTLTGVIPAGSQIKKTFEGIKAYNQGASVSPSGRVRYPIEQNLGTGLKTGLFGQYSTKRAREYFDNEESPLSDKQSEFVLSQDDKVKAFEQIKTEQAEAKAKQEQKETFKADVYQKVQELVNQGDAEGAKKMVDSLSDEDYETYKSIRASERSKRTTELRTLLDRSPAEAVTYLRSQNKEEQQRLLKVMTDEEYAVYQSAKEKLQ